MPIRPASFAPNELSFASSGFSDPQGSNTFAAIEWRIGEIDASLGEPRIYEIEELWRSSTTSLTDLSVSPPAALLIPDHRYRARVRHQDTSGRWSHWSSPLEFTAGVSDVLALQQGLIVSEIMYNPSTDQDHEYIELHNISEASLDLTGVGFSDGISFVFADGTSIAPGAYLLVVRDVTAFEERYGTGLPVMNIMIGLLGHLVLMGAGALLFFTKRAIIVVLIFSILWGMVRQSTGAKE